MAYHELAIPGNKPTLSLKHPAVLIDSFDLDYFGQDDGTEPDANFRLIFQLGSGYMIYLYVVGFPLTAPTQYFHTFWIKDCAVAEVDMEDLGAPPFVSGYFRPLPVVYKKLSLFDADKKETKYIVDACSFEVKSLPSVSIKMRWSLYAISNGKLAALHWNNTEGFLLEKNGKTRVMTPQETFTFSF